MDMIRIPTKTAGVAFYVKEVASSAVYIGMHVGVGSLAVTLTPEQAEQLREALNQAIEATKQPA